MTIVLGILLLLAGLTPALADNAWSRVTLPLQEPPQAIGFYSAGCLAGAEALPLRGRGYQVMRPSRHRNYGHPRLIAYIERLGQQLAVDDVVLWIGDLSQPRGGPMSHGHRSHQIGLDVDIWYQQGLPGRDLSRQETEQLPMLPVVLAADGRMNPARWSRRNRDALRLAAEAPQVERIFVNPIIKQALCRSEGERNWLRKIRPWWGHDDHFHIRLACPPNSPLCRDQEPLPVGDGCDESLDQWVEEIQAAASRPPKPPKPAPEPVLPELCRTVLQGGYGLRSTALAKPRP